MKRIKSLVALIGLGACVAAHGASEAEAARSDAEKGTTVLEQRPCPPFGDKRYLAGMSNTAQIAQGAEQEQRYQDQATTQLQQIARDAKLDAKQRTELQNLASWSVAASMANWSLLQVAQQAQANPLVVSGQAYPSAPIQGAVERVRRTADMGGMAADAAEVLRRQARALDRCSQAFSLAVFQLNQPQFDAAVDKASTLAELQQIEQTYRAREAAQARQGADSLDKLAARRTALVEAERAARENSQAVNAADAARRQADMEKRQSELRAKLPAWLAAAKRFAEASQRGDERAAIGELSPDIVMITPTGTFRGIDQVVSAVRRQSASGRGGSLGAPQIAGNEIVAYGSSGGMGIKTTFGFDAGDRISRMEIRI